MIRYQWAMALFFFLALDGAIAQQDISSLKMDTAVSDSPTKKKYQPSDIYHIKPLIDLPVTAAGYVTNYIGLQIVNRQKVDSADLASLDINNIPAFDRGAARQDPDDFERSHLLSDIGLKSSFAIPFLLMLDKDIRKNWWEIIVLYLETHSLTGNIYSMGTAHIHRKRPLVYNPDTPLYRRLSNGGPNSFYSGHVASTAASMFFMTKVYLDYHPALKGKKWFFYGAATLLPAFVGYYRYRAGKHFPSDIVAGFAGGAAMGILIPQIHKWSKKKGLSIVPIIGDETGLAMRLKL